MSLLLTHFEPQNREEKSTMSYNEEHCVRSRQPTLPSFSSRTLHLPSFLPLYMTASFPHHHTDCSNQTVHPIIPMEFFYTDPTMSSRRIPNTVTELAVFDCFQLNTPAPVMSACVAPPAAPDPFRSGPHPVRNLGSLAPKINTLHPPANPRQVILQLTQEEDQAVTNLLKLHHQDETLTASQTDVNPFPLHPEPMDSTSAEEAYNPLCSDVQLLMEARCWSDTELEAADTLLSGFSLTEKDKTWVQYHNKSAATLPDPLHQCQGSETALISSDCIQKDLGYITFGQEPGWGDTKNRLSISGRVKERMLSDCEGDAVRGLLSLGDVGPSDIVQ